MTTPTDSARTRILHVAAELFVAHGFKATTVRRVCEAAQVNVSMVNYYFHSKEDLYHAAVEYAREQEIKEPQEGGLAVGRAKPEEQLRQFIESFLMNLLLQDTHSLLTKLITRELVEPSGAIQNIITNDIMPQHRRLAVLVRAIAGEGLSDEEVQQCNFSIIGQALFYAHNRPINELIAPAVRYDEAGIRHIAEHIHRFTLGALKHQRKLARSKA
jgi:AcrR family transcriptional regulator